MTEEKLGAAWGRRGFEGLQHGRNTMLETYVIMAKEALEVHASEKRHRLCKLWHPNIYSRSDSPSKTSSIAATIHDGAEMAGSHCPRGAS